MIKKLLFVFLLGMIFHAQKTEAQSACPYTYTVSTLTANFNYLWVVTGITVIDSVHFDYGDGNQFTYMMPSSSNTHTYTMPGAYNVCLTRYAHTLGTSTVLTCTFCDSVIINGPTGVQTTETNNLSFYPNPSNASVRLKWPGSEPITEVFAYDIQGRRSMIRYKEQAHGFYDLDIADLPSGAYVVQARTAFGVSYSGRIIRQ